MFGMSYFIRIFVIQKATQKSLRRRSSQISTEAKVKYHYKVKYQFSVMKTYNYLEAVTADVLNYIDENNITVTGDNRDEIEQQLNDELWTVDSVTDNASGSYTFSAWQAEENLCRNLDLLAEACQEFESDAAKLLSDGAEACDVPIRCYLLGQAISAALDEVETEEEEEEAEEDMEE